MDENRTHRALTSALLVLFRDMPHALPISFADCHYVARRYRCSAASDARDATSVQPTLEVRGHGYTGSIFLKGMVAFGG
jgi:hypothetical protein